MKKTLFAFICALVAYSPSAMGWGQKGHDAIAYIAECNLTPEVYRTVVEKLGNHSLVYYANWMDNASHTPDYRYTKTWHYANVDKGLTYETMPKNENGDVVTAINGIVAKLKSGKLTPEQENINLRFLIHLVGDLHAPMHAGRLSDRGGNDVLVTFFYSKNKKLHSIWDTNLVEFCHKWSYTEWQQQLDKYCTPEQKSEIVKGDVLDWFNESLEIAQDIYVNTPPKTKILFGYVNHYTPVIERRFLAAGIRLARLLNEIYGAPASE